MHYADSGVVPDVPADRRTATGASADVDIEFESGPTAVSAARGALCVLESKVGGEVLEDLRLLVSEVVTNSIRHAESTCVRLRVYVAGNLVRVEITDRGRGFVPAPRAPNDTRIGGWGLYLVDRLADRWGVARDGLTRVWFELDRARSHGGGGAMSFAA